MKKNVDKVICVECGELVDYIIKTEKDTREINGIDYEFNTKKAICKKCGHLVTVPGLDDYNEKRLDMYFRKLNGYILVDEIYDILEKYDIEKRPLSRVLGMGEHTIERYLEGQLPSKKYSKELQNVKNDYLYMQKYFELFGDRLTNKASQKLSDKLDYYKRINSAESQLEVVALYILNSKYEITNLSLQKILYYVEGFSEVFMDKTIFDSPCEAWKYGPVYRKIYDKYKVFGNKPIIVEKKDYRDMLSPELVNVIDYVLDNFGIYNGTILKEFTHRESPWKEARMEYEDDEPCNIEIAHESIKEYFFKIDKEFNLKGNEGVAKYIECLRR